MGDLLIAMKIDPGSTLPTLEQAHAKLQQVETSGQRLTQAMSGASGAFKSLAQAMQQEQAALGRLNTLHEQLAVKNSGLVGSFRGIAEAMQREQQGLQALDSLLAKNVISTEQYAAQVTKLNHAIDGVPKQPGGAASSKSSGLFSGLGTQLGIGGLGGAGAIAGGVFAAKEVMDISDAWTEAENHARKFVDASHDIHQVMADQIQLSKDLHTNLAATEAAFDDVGDATERLNLSYSSTITLTKALSEAATLDYKSTGQLTQELMQLSVAFETGGRVAGPLRELFRDSPALAHLMMDNLHMTEQQIVEFAAKGKLSFKDVALALAQPGPALDKLSSDFNSRTLTAQQRWDEFKQDLEQPIDLVQLERMHDPVQQAAMAIQKQADALRDGTGAWKNAAAAADQYNRSLKDVIDTARKDIWTEQISLIGELQKGYGILTLGIDKYTEHTIAARKAWEEWARSVAHDPQLKALFSQVSGTATPTELQADQRALIAQDRNDTDFKAGSTAPMTANQQAAEKYRLELVQLDDMIQRGVVDQDEINNRIAQYNQELMKSTGVVDEHTKRQRDLEALLISIKKPQYDYQYGLSLLNEMLHDGAIKQGEYNDQVSKLREAYDSTQKHSNDFATGLEHGWHDIVKQSQDSAGQIQSALTGAFTDIQSSLEDMVLKGRLDLSSLGSELESILVKLAVQQATGALVGAIGGGMTGFDYTTPGGAGRYAFPGFATGGDMLVGGSGAPDSKLAMFRVTPGESIHVRTPAQQAAAARSGSGGPSHTILNLNYDPRAIRQGKDIETGVMAAIRSNAVAIRTLLGV